MDVKLDAIIQLFRKLDTSREREIRTFIDQNGGAGLCIEEGELFTKFLSKVGQYSTTGKMLKGQELVEVRATC